jgi:quaternary ammonium compound-resistance protein SugE
MGAMRLPMPLRFAMLRKLVRDPRRSSERLAMPWLILIIGGLFEVGFTTSLRFVDGFRNVPWTIAFLVSVAISMALLELASRSIPMGTAYTVWGGIGAVGTVVVGILWFHEPSTIVRLLLILAIVAAIAGLRFTAA